MATLGDSGIRKVDFHSEDGGDDSEDNGISFRCNV